MSDNPLLSHLLEGIIPPLGAAVVALLSEAVRGRLATVKLEQNQKRLQAIRDILEQEIYAVPSSLRQRLQQEVSLLAQSLLVSSRRADALSRTAMRVVRWERQPLLRRFLTLPRPRRSGGWVATVLCLLFLYLAALSVALVVSELRIASHTGSSAGYMVVLFLLLLVVTVAIPWALAWNSRKRLIQSARGRAGAAPWQHRSRFFRLVTVPRPARPSEFLAAFVWVLSSAWLLYWGAILIRNLVRGTFIQNAGFSIQFVFPEWAVQGVLTVVILATAAVYARNLAIEDARDAIREAAALREISSREMPSE